MNQSSGYVFQISASQGDVDGVAVITGRKVYVGSSV